MSSGSSLEVRRAQESDEPQILALLAECMGWSSGVEEDFFRWKHRDNPFGRSPEWVAVDGDRIVGYRTFLRWEFVDDNARHRQTVRAVDTITHPDYRGRGVFRSLTLTGVADLTKSGTAWVFNTPNDASRPGYLSMGWLDRGRVPVGVLPRSVRSMRTMVMARTPAELWSEPTQFGMHAGDALRDREVAEALLTHAPSHGVRTHRTPDYLAWRTAFPPLRYRLVLADEREPSSGGVIFRLRRRGPALEATVVESLVPSARQARSLCRRILTGTDADYVIGTRSSLPGAVLPLPGQGPRLAVRALGSAPPNHRDWQLSLADIELF